MMFARLREIFRDRFFNPTLLVLLLAPIMSRAQPVQGSTVPENRWLLIVETSRAMQKRSAATLQIVPSLVYSGMNGQMRPGDTLGLWTFNESLYTGKFPLQLWTPADHKIVARTALEFLAAQKYENDGNLGSITKQLQQIVKDSAYITVIIVSDGSSPIEGTPFDAEINASYKNWEKQQRASQMPFLTVLRAQGGKFTDHLVGTPPFALELPPLPPELLVKPKPPEVKSEPQPAPVTLPPLIISGRKHEPETAPTVVEPVPSSVKPEPVAESVHPEALKILESQPASNEEPKTVVAVVTESNPAPAQISPAPLPAEALVTPSPDLPRRTSRIWLVAPAVIGLFILVALLAMRRSRNRAGASLITRSLDRDLK